MTSKYSTWYETTRDLLDELREKYDALATRRDELEDEMSELTARISAAQDLMQHVRETRGDTSAIATNGKVDLNEIRRLGSDRLLKAYTYLANHNDGMAICTEAAAYTVRAGLHSNKTSALHSVHNTLWRAVDTGVPGWEKVGKGKYRYTRPSSDVSDKRSNQTNPNRSVVVAFGGSYTSYCRKEHVDRPVSDAKIVRHPNGSHQLAGNCSVCGGKIRQFIQYNSG